MVFSSAISRLTDKKATKPPFFSGYFRRDDAEHPQDYNPEATGYGEGVSVTYRSARYICRGSITPGESGKVGKFDPKKWKRADFDHTITGVNKGGDEFECQVTFSLDGASYSGFDGLEIDPGLMKGLMSDLWRIENTDDLEASREGGSGDW